MNIKRAVPATLIVFRIAAMGQSSPPVPSAYGSLYSELQGDLTGFSQSISGQSGGNSYTTNFAGQLMTANSDLGPALTATGYYPGTVLPELQELQALGMRAVTVHINFPVLYQPYFSNSQDYEAYANFYQQLSQQIHSAGMKMIVETSAASPESGAASTNFLSYCRSLSWSDYMAGRAQQAVNIAQLLQPDYLSVITEPDTEALNAGQPNAGTLSGSLQQLQTILAALQAATVTNIPVGAGAGTWMNGFSQVIQSFATTPIGYIDIHLNSVSNNFPQNALSAATIVRSAGLPIAMSEAWCKKVSGADMQSNPGNLESPSTDALDTFSFWQPLDQLFLQSLVNMSQAVQFQFVSPSWTGFYFASLDYGQFGSQPASQIIQAAQSAALSARQNGSFSTLGPTWENMILTAPDSTPPQTPVPPSINQVNQTFAQVVWSPTTDDVGVAGYNLFRNGALIYTSSQVGYTDTSLSPSTNYSYQVQAFDASGNVSGLSGPTSTTTLAALDTTPPSTPGNLQGTALSNVQIQLTWSASTDNDGVSGYQIFRGPSASALSPLAIAPGTSFLDNSASPNTTYYYAVTAYDPAGNYSSQSTAVAVTSPTGVIPPGPVPAAYQSLYNELQGDIASFSQAISATGNGSSYPTTYASQALTTNSDEASDLIGPNYFGSVVMPELLELQAVGSGAVTVHINFPILYEPYYGNQDTFQQYVTFYQNVAQQIRSMGMKMIVETTVASPFVGNNAAGYQPYYQSLGWNDYINGRAQQAVNVAQLIQPDYMSVITEPDSEAQNSGQPTAGTPAGSLQELQTILGAIQAAHVTNVPVGAGAGTWINSFSTYIQNVISTPVSYIDLHLYSLSNSFPENALSAAAMAHAAGLPISMSETWCKKISVAQQQANGGVLNNQSVDALGTFSFWEPLDQMFLQSLVNLSQAAQFQFISPFWTGFYFSYLDYNQYGSQSTSQILLAAQSAQGNARQTGAFSPLGPAWESMILPVPDNTAPQTPAAPTSGQVGQTVVSILWNATTDNVGVAGYNLFRNGTLLTTSSLVNYVDNSVSPATNYTYQLQAFDAAGNISALSPVASITTLSPPDNTPPSTPLNLQAAAVSDQQIQLTWSPSTDNAGIAGYRVYRGVTAGSMSVIAIANSATFTDTMSIYPNAIFYYAVQAFDPSRNYSVQSATVMATALPDTTSPTPPTGLVATGTGYQQVNLTWTASTDDIRVASYTVYRGKTGSPLVALANSTATSFTDTYGLAPGTAYTYAVAASDPSGNLSAQSSTASAVTSADTQPPSIPQNVSATAAGMQQVSLTWTASTDNVSVQGYNIYRGKTASSMVTIGNTTSQFFNDNLGLVPGTTYYYAVAAYDEVINVSPQSAVASVTTAADAQPPTAPKNVVATAAAMQQVNLTWSASTDNVTVSGYTIYRGKTATSLTILANSSSTSFSDTLGLLPGTTYYYAVVAYDEVNNTSVQSSIANSTTLPDTQPPSAPQTLTGSAGGMQQVNLSWAASTDNVTVSGYNIYRGKSQTTMVVVASATATSLTDTLGLTPGATYYYSVVAYDEVNNKSAQCPIVAVTTLPDTQPPTAPQNISAAAAGMQQVNLTWSSSTDNVSVSGYNIFRGKSASSLTLIGNAPSTSFSDNLGLMPGTTYYYAIVAYDEVANNSVQSAVTMTTTVADTQPPSAPQSLAASAAGMLQVNLTWATSTDNVMVSGYTVYRGKTASSMVAIGNATAGAYVDTAGLRPGQVYYYAVTAFDSSGNNSAQTPAATVTTAPDTQPPTVPQSLVLTAGSGTQITLAWSPSTDNVAVASYRIYRGTTVQTLTLIGSSSTASYADSLNLKALQTYYYTVAAVDSSGNVSAQSSITSIVNP